MQVLLGYLLFPAPLSTRSGQPPLITDTFGACIVTGKTVFRHTWLSGLDVVREIGGIKTGKEIRGLLC